MSSENHDDSSPELLELSDGVALEAHRQPRNSYTRDFLLSLRELDICQKLPAGFDASLLSEIDEASSNPLQQHRSVGGYYSHSSRRNDYGYVQTNRSENSGNYFRGSQGKWETRSSGSSDREELQIDRDASAQEIGKHNSNHPRRSWKQTEHDSLLGKPSGYSGQTPSQRSAGNGLYTLNKSSEPYQPPRPYKAPFLRDNNDSVNDETFGSSECSEDKAEEERKRRASFESMRKEQQKSLQEKQKQASSNKKGDVKNDPLASSKNPLDFPASRSKIDDADLAPSQSDSSKNIPTQLPASRPRVPPGFQSATAVKNVSVPPSEATFAPEAGKSGPHVHPILTTDAVESGVPSGQEMGSEATKALYSDDVTYPVSNGTKKVQASSPLKKSFDPSSYLPSDPSLAMEGWMDSAVHSDFTDNHDTKTTNDKLASQVNPTSILDKLFQNAVKQTDGKFSNFAEETLEMDDNSWSPSPVLSSKFCHLFPEERTKPEEKDPQDDPLSRIFSSEKVMNREAMAPDEISAERPVAVSPDRIPSEEVTESLCASFPFESIEASQKFPDIAQTTETDNFSGRKDTNAGILTCEDLEQLILAEANATAASGSVSPQLGSLDAKSEPSTSVNDYASQHLLSLLHVGTVSQDVSSNLNVQTSQNFSGFDNFDSRAASEMSFPDNSTSRYSSTIHNVEKSSTLEGLFGAAFMKELQSTGAPLSVQTGASDEGFAATAAASHAHGLSTYHSKNVVDDPASLNGIYDYNSANEVNVSMPHDQMVHHHCSQGAWEGFQASKVDAFRAHKLDNDAGHREIRLPGEESLINAGGDLTLISDTLSGNSSGGNSERVPLKSRDGVSGKVSTLNSIFGNEQAVAPSLLVPDSSLPSHGSLDLADSDHPQQQLLGRQSSPLHQISQTGPPFQHLDSHDHVKRHAKFISTDGIPYDTQGPLPSNIISPQSFHNVGSRFNSPAHLAVLHNNMPAQGNALHELHGYLRVATPSHATIGLPNMLELKPMQGLPMVHKQSNLSDRGMEAPGMGMGGAGPNHPEALERLLEMEMRAARQTRPLAGNHPHGLYGPEVDLGFRFI